LVIVGILSLFVDDSESYRKRIFQLLISAYSTITVADVAHFMGMSEEDATNCMFFNHPVRLSSPFTLDLSIHIS
jgi:hypothetical protein